MEFHINTSHATVNAGLVDEVLWQIDPASIAHLTADGCELRVNIEMDATQLLAVLQSNELPIDAADIIQIPSTCCGGCGG